MLFSAKSKNFFIDFNDHSVLVARTSKESAPFVIEEICECPPDDVESLVKTLKLLQPIKSQSGYVHAVCGINSRRRLIRKLILEIRRLKESEYLNEVIVQQLRIEPDQYLLAILNSATGGEYDLIKPTKNEAVVCGLPMADIQVEQDKLLAAGIYPEALELSTIAGAGAMIDYLAFAKIKAPVLLLEIGTEATNSFIVTANGIELSRPIQQGLEAMIPLVQKELGLKDEASARRLFMSNTFDFTGMGSILVKRLIKELQSSVGFYEVQTGQSVAFVACVLLPTKLAWLETSIALDLGISVLKADIAAWLQSHKINFADSLPIIAQDIRRIGLLGLMVKYNNNPISNENIK